MNSIRFISLYLTNIQDLPQLYWDKESNDFTPEAVAAIFFFPYIFL